MNITKLTRTCPQFSPLTCQEVWTYMGVSNGIQTTDPHMISIHGFVDILELSFPALAVILSICPRTDNWVAVCIVYCSLSLRTMIGQSRSFKRQAPLKLSRIFQGPETASEIKQKLTDHIESYSPRLDRVTYFKQVRNNVHNIRFQAISLLLFIYLQNRKSFRRRTRDVKCAIQFSLKVLSETFLAPADI
jgi:hypothetical protein